MNHAASSTSRIEPYRLIEYTSEQRGLPAARHWRHFEQTDDELASIPNARAWSSVLTEASVS